MNSYPLHIGPDGRLVPLISGSGSTYDANAWRHSKAGAGRFFAAADMSYRGALVVSYALTQDHIYAMPLIVGRDLTIPAIYLWVLNPAPAGGSVAGGGLYAPTSATDLYPGALIASVENVPIDVVLKRTFAFASTPAITAGSLVWVAFNPHASMNTLALREAGGPLGWSEANIDNLQRPSQLFDGINVYGGTMPDPFPAGASMVGAATDILPAFFIGGW